MIIFFRNPYIFIIKPKILVIIKKIIIPEIYIGVLKNITNLSNISSFLGSEKQR